MKHLIIAGVPRAGKSTLARRLAQEYGYQYISMDAIIAAFEKCFPETGVNTYQGLSSMDTLRLISGKMAPFLRAMLESGQYDRGENGAVVDMYQLLPEDYEKNFRGANTEIIYLLSSDVTPEEQFALQKRYDTARDYTFFKTDEELKEGAEYIVEQSLLMKEQCLRLRLKFYETGKERQQAFEQILRELEWASMDDTADENGAAYDAIPGGVDRRAPLGTGEALPFPAEAEPAAEMPDSKELKEAETRISAMEEIYDRVLGAVERAEAAGGAEKLRKAAEDLRKLLKYYESPLWMQDYDLSEAGLLPDGMKRAVVSQDGIWNLLTDYTRITGEQP